MPSVSIVGVRGYAGGELLRLVSRHPGVEVASLYGRAMSEAGSTADALPHLAASRPIAPLQEFSSDQADIVFLSVPADVAQEMAPAIVAKGRRVVDLSGGHRLPPDLYPRWYGLRPETLSPAAYGLTEFRREAVASARLVANPGCYATALLLGLAPLAEAKVIEDEVMAVGYSGVSGAGKDSRFGGLGEMSESIQPYKPFSHQHTPEVEEAIRSIAGQTMRLSFLPHVAPLVRGIMINLFIRPRASEAAIREVLAARYAEEPFVRVLGKGLPDVKRVRGTNRAEIAVAGDGEGKVAVFVAIDNLGKGAAGQAVQNMNVMLNMPEQTGLEQEALWP